MRFAVVAAVLAGAPAVVVAGPYDGWAPHRYCNALEGIEATRIPPLTPEQAALVESLEQVQVIARHGARAPYARLYCWEERKHNPMDAEWDCTTTSVSHVLLDEIYLRSDDQERTLGSGQMLMDGLFPVDGALSRELHHMLSWNVADIAVDYINANDNICPLMGHIGELANDSPEFWAHVRDPATVEIETNFHDLVGNFSWGSVLECLSTARCNNLELPHGIDEETFTKTFHEVEVRQGLYLTYNNSWYAKVAMQPLAHELLTRLDGVLDGAPNAYKLSITMGTNRPCLRSLWLLLTYLVVVELTRGLSCRLVTTAHDSTLMPFLAAVARENWDRTWTPYAGMLVTEIYKTKKGSYAARMIFHGQPLLLPDCHDSTYNCLICHHRSLCDIDDFLQTFEFARTERNCKLPKKKAASSSLMTTANNIHSSFHFSKYLGSCLLLGLVVIAAFLGLRGNGRRNQQDGGRWRDEGMSLLG
ncbi:hypothetical protein BBJ28_00005534 [Nothophytophthora sp. Chile5]|nr:hypothetical protein BBJ28_00005534 [Nothophytophthora sp. Chile5]